MFLLLVFSCKNGGGRIWSQEIFPDFNLIYEPYRYDPRTLKKRGSWIRRLIKDISKLKEPILTEGELKKLREEKHRKRYARSYEQIEKINAKKFREKIEREIRERSAGACLTESEGVVM